MKSLCMNFNESVVSVTYLCAWSIKKLQMAAIQMKSIVAVFIDSRTHEIL